jgi:hypothetical protein
MRKLTFILALLVAATLHAQQMTRFQGKLTFTIMHIAADGTTQPFGGTVHLYDTTDPNNVVRKAVMPIQTQKTCTAPGAPADCRPGWTEPVTLTLPLSQTDASGKMTFWNYRVDIYTDNASPIRRQSKSIFGPFVSPVPSGAVWTMTLDQNFTDTAGFHSIVFWNGVSFTPGVFF